MEMLKGAVGLVLAGEGGASLHGRFKGSSHFAYLTGIDDEPGAALLLDPTHEDPDRREVLFLKPRDPEMERWDGAREPLGGALKSRVGIRCVLRTLAMPGFVSAAGRRSKRLACLHPFSGYESAVSPDLAIFRKVCERVVGCGIEDRTDVLRTMRAVKSEAELALMRRAIDITGAGFVAALHELRPGLGERALQRVIERTYEDQGGEGLAYESIVGSGFQGTVLHYTRNDGPTKAGELVVIDSGAKFGGYSADITRTLPVSGKFTPAQRALYEVVLEAQEAAIEACRPGVTLSRVGAAARAVIEGAGLGDAFIHGIGHHLGMDVHDLDGERPLEPGMVVTIEPGVYLPERSVGIRIEDDILITRSGRENLSRAIPKSVAQIEAAMND
jgi:Xaa-Pro aminopeptidase